MKYSYKRKTQREEKRKKVIRCSIVNGPVFEYETCSKFELKSDALSDSQQNCKNCIYSF